MPTIPPLALAAALLLPLPAPAQDQAVPREGDIWNGKAHVLPPSEIHEEEKSAGVALSPAQRRSQDEAVERLERRALQGVQEGPGAGSP